MRNELNNKLRMAGVAVAVGIGASGFLAVLTVRGGGPDDRTANSVGLVSGAAHLTAAQDADAGSDAADRSSFNHRPSVIGGLVSAPAGEPSGGSSGGDDGDGSDEASGSQAPRPEEIEVVIPHRIIVTLPKYEPGTLPTVHRPTADLTPPAVTNEGNRIIVDLPQANTTPPRVEQGTPGRLTPPSVAYE